MRDSSQLTRTPWLNMTFRIYVAFLMSSFLCDVTFAFNSEHSGWGHAAWNKIETCHIRNTKQARRPSSFTSEDYSCPSPASEDELRKKRVIGGWESDAGQWPWLVAIGRKSRGPQCGGSIISPYWVLTAAHCFATRADPCDYNARLGEHNIVDDTERHVDITLEEIVVHPGYRTTRDGKELNDVALVKLSLPAPVENNTHIGRICLAGPVDYFPVGTHCIVAGLGKTSALSAYGSPVVRHIGVPFLSKFQCRRSYGLLPWGQFCAGQFIRGKDSCQGDSGGPLVCPSGDKGEGGFVQFGIVSWGVGCGEATRPGMYSSVPAYRNWILSTISGNP